MSLYLKYRPQDFATMVGQAHATQTIRNALSRQSLAHAYLFCGPRGTGKTSLARIVAKAINCQKLTKQVEPCNDCDICLAIQEGRMVDLIEIDAASNRGIDEIRELREKINFSPSQAKAKVYIIDEVHMLTKEAFNALLKTLEEPPGHAYFVLATTEAHKIPETIISRCQQFTFKRIELEAITNRLAQIAEAEKVSSENEALKLIAKASNGGLRDAIGLFEQLSVEGEINAEKAADRLGLTGNAFIEHFFQALVDQKPLMAMQVIDRVNGEGKNLNQFATEVIGYLREQMLAHIKDANRCQKIMNWIEVFNEARLKLGQSSIPQLPLEMAVIRMCEFESKDNDSSAARLETMTEKSAESNQKEDVMSVSPSIAVESPTSDVAQPKHPRPAQSGNDSGEIVQKTEREISPLRPAPAEMTKKEMVPAEMTNEGDAPVETKKEDIASIEMTNEEVTPVKMISGEESVPVEISQHKKIEEGEVSASTHEPEQKEVDAREAFIADEQEEKQKVDPAGLTLDYLQQNWSRVLEQIETPFVKMSLMDGKLVAYDDGKVSLKFNSTTLMEKVQTSKSHAEVTAAIEKVFSTKLELAMEVKKIQFSQTQESPKKSIQPPKKDSMVDMAEEVFGVTDR